MTETAVQKQPPQARNSAELSGVLSRYEDQIAQALPVSNNDLNAKRIIQITATVITQNPKLRVCDTGSVIAAVMQAAILGLNPLPSLAECYFIPYGKDCTFQVGYKGWVNLYYRSKLVQEIYAHVVRKGDEFEYELGLEKKLRHVVKSDTGDDVTHVYAVVKFKGGGHGFVVLTRKEIDKLKARGAGGPAWKTDFEPMCQAKALKQLKRFIPSDGSIDAALASDERIIPLEAFNSDRTGLNLAALPDPTGSNQIEMKQPNFLGAGDEQESEEETVDESTGEVQRSLLDSETPPSSVVTPEEAKERAGKGVKA